MGFSLARTDEFCQNQMPGGIVSVSGERGQKGQEDEISAGYATPPAQ